MALAVAFGFLQMAAYFASNPAVGDAQPGPRLPPDAVSARAVEEVGQVLLARWTANAFLVYYVLRACVLLILAWALRRSTKFPPAGAWWALSAGVLILVPSSFGMVGMIVALASLIPWSVLCIVLRIALLRLTRV